ncbi:hypothetical protein D3C78_834080 [compost metagenome]
MGDAGDFRTEAIGVLRLATDVHGEQGTAVEAVERGDDLVLLAAITVERDTTGQLEGGLVGFGAGVAEEGAVGKGGVDQFMRQAQGRLIGEHVGHVPQLVRLLGQGTDQRRMRVAQYVNGNPAGEVDQLATGLVPDAGTGATHRNECGRRIVGNHYLIEIGALYRSVLNGHRSLLKRKHSPETGELGEDCKDSFQPGLAAKRQLLIAQTPDFPGFTAMRHIGSQRRSLTGGGRLRQACCVVTHGNGPSAVNMYRTASGLTRFPRGLIQLRWSP